MARRLVAARTPGVTNELQSAHDAHEAFMLNEANVHTSSPEEVAARLDFWFQGVRYDLSAAGHPQDAVGRLRAAFTRITGMKDIPAGPACAKAFVLCDEK
jgi:hypothetical protein